MWLGAGGWFGDTLRQARAALEAAITSDVAAALGVNEEYIIIEELKAGSVVAVVRIVVPDDAPEGVPSAAALWVTWLMTGPLAAAR